MKTTTMILTLAALFVFGAPVEAQTLPVKVGDRVRVTAPDVGRRRGGIVRLFTMDTLLLRPDYGARSVAIPLASITRLEVRQGQKSQMGSGAGIGLLGGGLLGYVISSGILGGGCTEGGGFLEPTREQCIGLSAVGGALAGTLIGLVVGAMATTYLWEEVPLRRNP